MNDEKFKSEMHLNQFGILYNIKTNRILENLKKIVSEYMYTNPHWSKYILRTIKKESNILEN